MVIASGLNYHLYTVAYCAIALIIYLSAAVKVNDRIRITRADKAGNAVACVLFRHIVRIAVKCFLIRIGDAVAFLTLRPFIALLKASGPNKNIGHRSIEIEYAALIRICRGIVDRIECTA